MERITRGIVTPENVPSRCPMRVSALIGSSRRYTLPRRAMSGRVGREIPCARTGSVGRRLMPRDGASALAFQPCEHQRHCTSGEATQRPRLHRIGRSTGVRRGLPHSAAQGAWRTALNAGRTAEPDPRADIESSVPRVGLRRHVRTAARRTSRACGSPWVNAAERVLAPRRS